MGALNFDLSSLSPRLLAAIGFSVILMIAFALFPTISGAAQGFSLAAKEGGSCETNAGHRFDRAVVLANQTFQAVYADGGANGLVANPGTDAFTGSPGEETDANKYDWSNGYTVAASNCQVQGLSLSVNSNATGAITVPFKMLTADGTEIAVNAAGQVGTAKTAVAATPTVANADASESASIFADNRTITNVIIGAVILLIGVSPIAILGGIGYQLLNMFTSGMSGITRILIGVLGAIIAVTLLNLFVDFLSIAYDAVDANRFSMYEYNVASLATTIRQFWGLIFIAGFLGLAGMMGWQHLQKRKAGGGQMRSDSSMMG